MEDKKNNIFTSNIENTSSFIKSLGGPKKIYNFLVTKDITINIDSIYKWKVNGIPHRYLLYVKELSDNKSIIIPEGIFPNNISPVNTTTEIISNSENDKQKIKNKNSKVPIYITLTILLLIIFQFLYYQYNNNIINKKILKLEKATSSIKVVDYSEELILLNNKIKEKNILSSNNLLKINTIIETNNNKIKDLESNIIASEDFNKSQDLNLSEFNKILIHLFVIKENIKYSIPDLSNINIINNYFTKISIPEDINLALENINNLSRISLVSHKQLKEEFATVMININKSKEIIPANKDKINILSYVKQLVKITRIDNNKLSNIINTPRNIINKLDIYNYEYVLNTFKNSENNLELNSWLKNVKNHKILIDSINNIINWLIFKG
jgi:hypothetical protein